MPSWLLFIFIAANLFSWLSILDKFFCEKQFKNTYSLAFLVNLFGLAFIFILSFFIKFSFSLSLPFLAALASGPFYLLMWILWWKAIQSGEISRASAIFGTAPFFTALLAIVFLGEVLTQSRWLAIFLIVGGTIICSWERKTHKKINSAYVLVILAAMVAAVGNVLTKMAASEIEAMAIFALAVYGCIPFYLLFLIKKEVRAEVKKSLRNKKLMSGLFIRTLIWVVANGLFYLSMAGGPVSLVTAVNATGPVFVFIYSILLSLFLPRFIKEEINPQVLLTKTLAILSIVGGVILINL